jgi:hypothetical protein
MAALTNDLKGGLSDPLEVIDVDGPTTARANEALCDGDARFTIFFRFLHDLAPFFLMKLAFVNA